MQLEEKIKSAIREIPDYPKPGISFKDITPVLTNPALVSEITKKIIDQFKSKSIDAIVAVEARGFIFGSILAHQLNCRFVPVRKSGKLPYKTLKQEYSLEYGTASVEMHLDAIEKGSHVLIHDDLLATGGTAEAAGKLVRESGGIVAGFSFLVNLSFLPGEQTLVEAFGIRPHYLVSY